MNLKAFLVPPMTLATMVVALAFVPAAPAAAQPATCPAQTVGTIEKPADGAFVSGFVQVVGFALDGNLVSNVDLFVDGTDDGSRVTPQGGMNINIPRPDVLQAFPAFAATAGKDPGFQTAFRAANYANGSHTLNVRITDVTGCAYFLTARTVRIDNSRNQAPFGNVDFPRPDDSVSANGVLSVTGWALDDRQVDHVSVYVDGLLERDAVAGIYRADIGSSYPGVPGALVSGWVLNLDSTRWTNGVHQVTVKAVDDQGQAGLLGVRRVQAFNSGANLAPFGWVDEPLAAATWFGNCFNPTGGPSGGDIQDPRYIMYVTGWALDTSVALERGGVSHVFLELDGVQIKDTRINCHREPFLANQMVDCYGYYRPDVEVFYPGFPMSPNVGFHFGVDVGYLVTKIGVSEGSHMLQVKAADKEDNVTLLREVPVYLECATQQFDPTPLGYVDDPSNYKIVNGVFPVIGWAIDLDTVNKVQVMIDGVVQIDAVRAVDYAEYGLSSPDVAAVYPNFPGSNRSRFRFYLDTTKLSNSEHDLMIQVVDGRGNVRSAGTRRFLVNNNTLVR